LPTNILCEKISFQKQAHPDNADFKSVKMRPAHQDGSVNSEDLAWLREPNIYRTDIGASRFNLHEFYIRRLRRLFTAMLATVLLCYLLFAAVMPPPDFRQQAESSAFAIASLANVYFYLKTG
jgi:hypothetical protein